MYSNDGNDSRAGRNGWGDRQYSFNYDIIDANVKIVTVL